MPVVSHEGTVPSFGKESRIDQRAEHCAARVFVESPEALRLLRRETQAWHFQELAAHASHDVL